MIVVFVVFFAGLGVVFRFGGGGVGSDGAVTLLVPGFDADVEACSPTFFDLVLVS